MADIFAKRKDAALSKRSKLLAAAKKDETPKGGMFRSRIKELRHVRAGSLIPNEKNWRRHPERQMNALQKILSDIGFADAVLAYETPKGLKLFDGHAREELTNDDCEIPVLVTDLTEEEADLLLTTLDPLSAMADTDTEALDALLRSLRKDDSLNELLDGMNIHFPDLPADDEEETKERAEPKFVADAKELASLEAVLRPLLKDISLENFVALMINEFDAISDYIDLLDGHRAAQRVSLLFNPHRFDTRTNKSKSSIYAALKTDAFLRGLARALLFNRGDRRGLNLYQAFSVGVNGIQYVNEFHPYLARDILQRYKLDENARVLDPCAGWGGRMLGASAVANTYHAFEPCTRTHAGLNALAKFIQRFRPDFKSRVKCLPFEDAKLTPNFYDAALTSPPYYDTEIYSDEETNSLNRYATFKDWLDGFFFPMIHKTMSALKADAPFVINIGSRKYPISKHLHRACKGKYKIRKLDDSLGHADSLGRKEGEEVEGETFYELRHD